MARKTALGKGLKALIPDVPPEYVQQLKSIKDNNGNSTTCTQYITISDVTNPTASNPAPASVECIGDIPLPDINVVTDEADNCPGAPVVALVSNNSDGMSCPETVTRIYSVTDICGNSINVTQTITIDDVTNPTASNLGAVNVECIGDVPAAGTIQNNLSQGGVDFLIVPLDQSGQFTMTADGLAADIGDVSHVGTWSTALQRWLIRVVGSSGVNFPIRLGYPYGISTGSLTPPVWP